jgi:hypothetical protein
MQPVKRIASALFTSAILLTAGVAQAQTGTTTGTTTVPGVPNTGAGGDISETAMILGVSAAIVAFGIAALLMYLGYLARGMERQ